MVDPEKNIEALVRGVYQFMNKRFPPDNYNTHPSITEDGFHMDYLGVEYEMSFVYDEDYEFRLLARLPQEDRGLIERIGVNRVSNKKLGQTRYLKNQRIDSNGSSVDLSCKLKKIPGTEKEIEGFYHDLWGFVIQRIMLSVTGKIYSEN